MILRGAPNQWNFRYKNQAAGSVTPGTQLTSGSANTKGSWVSLATGSNIAFDVYYVHLIITAGASSTSQRSWLYDFGWDPAGGTSYVAFFSNLVAGAASPFANNTGTSGGREFHFPCYIKAGSQVAMRAQCQAATQTSRVLARFYGKPARPDLVATAAYAETIGAITNSSGVSFTPGNAADGSWVSLGTTTKALWWWQVGHQVDNAGMSNESTIIELATGDGSNKHIIAEFMSRSSNAEDIASGLQTPCEWYVPAGGTLYIRGNNSDAPDSGYNAVAVGFGG